MTMEIELTSLRYESDPLSAERREALEQALERIHKEVAWLEEQWQAGTFYSSPPSRDFAYNASRARATAA